MKEKPKKNFSIVTVKANKNTNLIYRNKDANFHHKKYYGDPATDLGDEYRYIHILTDEEVKDGDLFYSLSGVQKAGKGGLENYQEITDKFKVVVTTDEGLGLPILRDYDVNLFALKNGDIASFKITTEREYKTNPKNSKKLDLNGIQAYMTFLDVD